VGQAVMKLLDLFCGAGGAAVGYSQAGFDEIVGVDINPQRRYPFQFVQADALEYLAEHGHEFDVIHASPPCQGYSPMRNLPQLKDKEYPLLIEPTQELLDSIGKPWVIENVMGARLEAGWLCGAMFGLPFYRHRYFLTNWFWLQPGHPRHIDTKGPSSSLGGKVRDFVIKSRLQQGNTNTIGHASKEYVQMVAEAMEIDWMERDELTQAIPPAYTRWIGRSLTEVMNYGATKERF